MDKLTLAEKLTEARLEVTPLRDNKKPYIKDWINKHFSYEDIKREYQKSIPGFNIGIKTGTYIEQKGYLGCIDIDLPIGDNLLKKYIEYLKEKANISEVYYERTPSGGVHIFFFVEELPEKNSYKIPVMNNFGESFNKKTAGVEFFTDKKVVAVYEYEKVYKAFVEYPIILSTEKYKKLIKYTEEFLAKHFTLKKKSEKKPNKRINKRAKIFRRRVINDIPAKRIPFKELKESLSIDEVCLVLDYLGEDYTEVDDRIEVCCPFHPPDNNPSLIYFDNQKAFFDYHTNEYIDLIQFVRERLELKNNFEALKWIAKITGKRVKNVYANRNEKFVPRKYSEILTSLLNIRYQNEVLYIYDDNKGIWIEDPKDEYIKSYLRINNILDENLIKNHYINEIVSDIKGLTYQIGDFPEPPKHLIPCANGVFNLNTKELEPYKPEYYFTFKLPWKYDLNAKGGFLEEIINSFLPPKEVITLYELLAYILYRGYEKQKFFFLYGSGRNGKSLFAEIITKLVGSQNVSTVSLEELQNENFSTVQLKDKLVNIAGEVSYQELKETKLLKQLSGGDEIHADRKYKSPIKFRNKAKLVFITNEIPLSKDDSDGFYRRVFLIKFPYQFEDDPSIPIKIRQAEEEFNWLLTKSIHTLIDLLDRNLTFTNEKSIEEIREIYLKESNPVYAFIKEFCIQIDSDDVYIPRKEFLKNFNYWLELQNRPPFKENKLGRIMKELKIYYQKKLVKSERGDYTPNYEYCWVGIGWNGKAMELNYEKLKEAKKDSSNEDLILKLNKNSL